MRIHAIDDRDRHDYDRGNHRHDHGCSDHQYQLHRCYFLEAFHHFGHLSPWALQDRGRAHDCLWLSGLRLRCRTVAHVEKRHRRGRPAPKTACIHI